MTLRHRVAGLLIVAAALGFAGLAAASESDKREISGYALTEAGLGKFTQATQNLAAVPGACARGDTDDGGSGDESLDQLVARLNAVPGAQAAIQSAGMTTREYIVFMWSMMESGLSAWAVQQNGKLPIDSICLRAKLPMSKVSSALLNLEFQGLVRSLPGKIYSIA